MTADTGQVEERYEYDAFGTPYLGDMDKGMSLGYTGKPYGTATGLYNYGFRDYRPQTARFTTEDPVKDGSNWFAYVNNDPVNWVDPWGLSATDKKPSIIDKVNDVFGKILASPMTAIGLTGGIVLYGISKVTGNGGEIKLQNNAVTFTTGLQMDGSITLGNAIIHAGGDTEKWNAESKTDRYDNTAKVFVGKHEEAHTYQYQKYSIFTIPMILGSAILNGGLETSNFRDFMGKSRFEKEADDYSEVPGTRGVSP